MNQGESFVHSQRQHRCNALPWQTRCILSAYASPSEIGCQPKKDKEGNEMMKPHLIDYNKSMEFVERNDAITSQHNLV